MKPKAEDCLGENQVNCIEFKVLFKTIKNADFWEACYYVIKFYIKTIFLALELQTVKNFKLRDSLDLWWLGQKSCGDSKKLK